jgi:hypothetical protein
MNLELVLEGVVGDALTIVNHTSPNQPRDGATSMERQLRGCFWLHEKTIRVDD